MNDAQQHGIWLHGLMQHLSPPNQIADMQTLQQRLGIPARQMPDLWKRAPATVDYCASAALLRRATLSSRQQ